MTAYDPIEGQAEELDLLYRTYGISTAAVLGIALTGTFGSFGLTAGRMKLLPRVLLSPFIGITSAMGTSSVMFDQRIKQDIASGKFLMEFPECTVKYITLINYDKTMTEEQKRKKIDDFILSIQEHMEERQLESQFPITDAVGKDLDLKKDS
ncbi:unnamed protein product [Oikopleura dioica]|uniref:Transmembrane protein n=1 Tax=Oikopleura dioica TaxID=34765 RepID=E4XBI9_OIKDI|nr:unnamed protein product [Oikopleura dioica]